MVFFILKYFEKKEKIKSIVSWVQKLVKTKVPSRVYDMLYISLNVTNNNGGRVKAAADEIYEKKHANFVLLKFCDIILPTLLYNH